MIPQKLEMHRLQFSRPISIFIEFAYSFKIIIDNNNPKGVVHFKKKNFC